MTFAEELRTASERIGACPVIGPALADWLATAAAVAPHLLDSHALKTARAINAHFDTEESPAWLTV